MSPGLRHTAVVLADPRAVYNRVAVNSTYGWALAAILLITTLLGWVTVQTGLIDREIDRQTLKEQAQLEREQVDLMTRVELSEALTKIREKAEFFKLLKRAQVVVAAPLALLASLMCIAAVLFAAVALAGNKADFPTLMAICVYASVVEVLAMILRLAMMLHYRTLQVDTSLGLLLPHSDASGPLYRVLSGLDPFRAWFWVLIGIGLVVTGQLSRRKAILVCILFFLIGSGLRMIPMPQGA